MAAIALLELCGAARSVSTNSLPTLVLELFERLRVGCEVRKGEADAAAAAEARAISSRFFRILSGIGLPGSFNSRRSFSEMLLEKYKSVIAWPEFCGFG